MMTANKPLSTVFFSNVGHSQFSYGSPLGIRVMMVVDKDTPRSFFTTSYVRSLRRQLELNYTGSVLEDAFVTVSVALERRSQRGARRGQYVHIRRRLLQVFGEGGRFSKNAVKIEYVPYSTMDEFVTRVSNLMLPFQYSALTPNVKAYLRTTYVDLLKSNTSYQKKIRDIGENANILFSLLPFNPRILGTSLVDLMISASILITFLKISSDGEGLEMGFERTDMHGAMNLWNNNFFIASSD